MQFRPSGPPPTLALGQCPPGVGVFNHLMLQMRSIDDVGSAYDLLETHDVPLTLSLGRHTNDKTFGFYCATPSLFNVEVGFDGIEVGEDWVPYTYGEAAIWGHKLDPEAKNRPPGIVHALAE